MLLAAGGVSWGSATHVGRVRQSNEDSAAVAWPVFVVADGMGGHAAGEVASRIAVSVIGQLGERVRYTGAAHDEPNGSGDSPPPAPRIPIGVREITAQVAAANDRILESAARHPEQTGMGTTVAGLARTVAGGAPHWVVFGVGDSRVYRLVDGALSQVTLDHSTVAELVAQGSLSAEAARRHPARNVITRVVGRDPMPAVDTWLFPAYPGERFLLCSDGVSNELPDEVLERLLAAASDAQAAADTIVEAAVTAGGRDNCTAVVVVSDEQTQAGGVPGADEDTAPRSEHAPADAPGQEG